MRRHPFVPIAVLGLSLTFSAIAHAQPTPPSGAQPQPGGRGGPGGGGPRRGPVQVMTLTTPAWPDGGMIPKKHTQAGGEVSPAFTWSNVPADTVSFVLIAHDVDAAVGSGLDATLHWLVWNVPAASTGLPEGVPVIAQLPDGTRQVGATAPGYRGPGAAAAGPPHHYVFEVYALDTVINVPPVGQGQPQTPAQIREAVLAAMAGHVRGKGAYVGLFKR